MILVLFLIWLIGALYVPFTFIGKLLWPLTVLILISLILMGFLSDGP